MPILASDESNYNYFLQANLSKHKGEWVAIYDNQIVSSGTNVKKVAQEATFKCGKNKFLLVKVPSGKTMIF